MQKCINCTYVIIAVLCAALFASPSSLADHSLDSLPDILGSVEQTLKQVKSELSAIDSDTERAGRKLREIEERVGDEDVPREKIVEALEVLSAEVSSIQDQLDDAVDSRNMAALTLRKVEESVLRSESRKLLRIFKNLSNTADELEAVASAHENELNDIRMDIRSILERLSKRPA